MSETRTLILGTIAGMTILLGLPIGRLRKPMPGLRQFLNAVAIGILGFLVWDVVSHAWEPIDTALGAMHDHTGGFAPVAGYSALFFGGIGVGLLSLVYYERWLTGRRNGNGGQRVSAVGADVALAGVAAWSPARLTALLIAIGIGLHNFGEGLAIGASAGRGEIGLATVLVIGFALHNATEGFGIVAPLAAEGERPSWRFLLSMGFIGGAPTFFGTLVGQSFVNDTLFLSFLALAGGSILYVIVQLIKVAGRQHQPEVIMWGMFAGLVAGFATDYVLVAAGV